MNNYLIIIVGPTATGKSNLSVKIAKSLETEIISCDSRQFYKEMAIGTAAPTIEEQKGIKHHFVGHLGIDENYSAGHFEKDAIKKISELHKKKQFVVMVGGSGLYEKAIVSGLDDFPKINEETKRVVQEIYNEKSIDGLIEILKIKDPDYLKSVDLENHRRLSRAVEVCLASGKPYSYFKKSEPKERDFKIVKIGIECLREELYERINNRVDEMFEQGFLNEVKNIYTKKNLVSLQTIGFKEVFEYLDGKISLDEAKEKMKKNTRRYAKRQITWYKKDPSISWFSKNSFNEICRYIKQETSY